jgi:long-chain fatty acid transport protein
MIGTEQTWLRTEALPQWDVALRAGFWNDQKAILDATYNPAIPDGDSHAISVGFDLFCQGSGHFFGSIPCGDSEKALRPKGIKLSCTKFGPSPKTLIRRSMERTRPGSTPVRSICA